MQDTPSSPKRTQSMQDDDHIHWDPGGVKAFHGTIPPGGLTPFTKNAASTHQKQDDIHTLDEKLHDEVHGTAITLSIPSSISEELSSPLEGSVVMSCSPLPVTDNSYVLGLRPIVCSDTYTQLDRASYVTGMLPFIKLPSIHSHFSKK